MYYHAVCVTGFAVNDDVRCHLTWNAQVSTSCSPQRRCYSRSQLCFCYKH